MMFSSPSPSVVFLSKPNQTISTVFWQERNRKSNLNYKKLQYKETFCGFAETYHTHIVIVLD